MTSLGGLVLFLLLLGATFAERPWIRFLCRAYALIVVLTMIVLAVLGKIEPYELLPTGVCVFGGLVLHELKKSFDRSKY